MNPGVNQILGVVCSADVAEIENVTTIESVDLSALQVATAAIGGAILAGVAASWHI